MNIFKFKFYILCHTILCLSKLKILNLLINDIPYIFLLKQIFLDNFFGWFFYYNSFLSMFYIIIWLFLSFIKIHHIWCKIFLFLKCFLLSSILYFWSFLWYQCNTIFLMVFIIVFLFILSTAITCLCDFFFNIVAFVWNSFFHNIIITLFTAILHLLCCDSYRHMVVTFYIVAITLITILWKILYYNISYILNLYILCYILKYYILCYYDK